MNIKDIRKYQRNHWKDWWLKNKDERLVIDKGDGRVEISITEDNTLQKGTPVTAKRMNNIEEYLDTISPVFIEIVKNIDSMELMIKLLKIMVMGDVSGDAILQDFTDEDSIDIQRGVYNTDNKYVYCQNNEGETAKITGFGAALA